MYLLGLTFLLSLLLAIYGVPIAKKAALKYGIVDAPDGKLKHQREPVPYFGGLAIYLAFLMSLAFTFEFRHDVLGIILGGTIVVMLGLINLSVTVSDALHDRLRCRTVFATHFHELTALSGRLPELSLLTMRVKEWRGQVVFRVKDAELVSQLIDGTFPDYQQIIPRSYKSRTLLPTASLLKACKQAEIFAREGIMLTAQLQIQPGLRRRDADFGGATYG